MEKVCKGFYGEFAGLFDDGGNRLEIGEHIVACAITEIWQLIEYELGDLRIYRTVEVSFGKLGHCREWFSLEKSCLGVGEILVECIAVSCIHILQSVVEAIDELLDEVLFEHIFFVV